MKQGVMLVAWGKRGYQFMAYYMAASIKHYSPNMHVTLYTDDVDLKHLIREDTGVFDSIRPIPFDVLQPAGYIDPCHVKLHLYELCPYDETLFLDVDTLTMQPIEPIFEQMKEFNYSTYVYDTHTIDKGRDFPSMVWAWCDQIWEHFNLPQDAVLPATNSSIQFIRKCDETEKLFNQAQRNYANPIPINQLRWKWGGTQPDELYLNVALAQLGWKDAPVYMFLGDKHSPLSFEQIQNQYIFLSIYGGKGYTKKTYIDWYETRIKNMLKTKRLKYKMISIIADKHCNNRKAIAAAEENLHLPPLISEFDYKIEDSVLIDSKKLIQNYPDAKGSNFKVLNWFNCSMVSIGGKTILAYRMEGDPKCVHTKIGICELDKNFQPLENKLLDLHSNLKAYGKGFHVEDPRLFIHNDELYLSYTDGYQMLQAKIDPVSLTASESFYIKKPSPKRTEKNWTFFSHKGSLYSVYSIAPHVIYEMHGEEWAVNHREDFQNEWKWGEIRGGTSPVLTENGYLSFFHSSLETRSRRQYYMGAYLFESSPPFAPIAISEKPIMGGSAKFDRSLFRLDPGIWVVYPAGAIKTDKGWSVSFGNNDYECRVIEISDAYLEKTMVPVRELAI